MIPFPESHRSIPVASRTARLTFLGDALCQLPLLAAHETPGGHDFRSVFAPLRDFLADSDFVAANLETPLSEDGGDLTHERWRFNSPRAYAEDVSHLRAARPEVAPYRRRMAARPEVAAYRLLAAPTSQDRPFPSLSGAGAMHRGASSSTLPPNSGARCLRARRRILSRLISAPLRKPSPAVPSRTSQLRTSIHCSIMVL